MFVNTLDGPLRELNIFIADGQGSSRSKSIILQARLSWLLKHFPSQDRTSVAATTDIMVMVTAMVTVRPMSRPSNHRTRSVCVLNELDQDKSSFASSFHRFATYSIPIECAHCSFLSDRTAVSPSARCA